MIITVDFVPSAPGQHCCYDSEGDLLVGSPDGGSVDRVSPNSDPYGHFMSDTRPFILCCKTALPNCKYYYGKRPSGDGASFNPVSPGICNYTGT